MNILDLYGYIGDVAFCVGGVLVARSERLTLPLQTLCGILTTFAGGITRDLLMLGTTPKILGNPHELFAVAVFAVMLTLALSYSKGTKSKSVFIKKALVILDSIGVLAFVAVGFERGITLGDSYIIALIAGLFTACGGGFISLLLRSVTRKNGKMRYFKKEVMRYVLYYVFGFATTLTYGIFSVAGMSADCIMVILTAMTILLGLLADKEVSGRG